nr:glycosyl hydrolase family 18 protein [Stenotrophomonas bentonitica]
MSRFIVSLLGAAIVAALPLSSHAAPASNTVIGAYYPGGSAERYAVASIPADTLTHLFYAFARIEDGRCVVDAAAPAHFKALAALKRAHPQLHSMISIGGWNAGGFSDAALTPESRERFVAPAWRCSSSSIAAVSTAWISTGSSRCLAARWKSPTAPKTATT